MSNISNDVKARVLSAVSAIDPIVTNATNRTANFELPLFIGSDKPAWLVDWNNTMIAIDALMKQVDSTGSDNTTAISQLTTKLTDLEGIVNIAQSDITANSGDIAENANNIRKITNSLDTIQDDLISQNSAIKTHTTQIENLDGKTDTAINLANEGINKANTAQESANTGQSTINEYIREHSNFQYTPKTRINGVIIPGSDGSPNVTFELQSNPITGDTVGKNEVYGMLYTQRQAPGAPGIENDNSSPYIFPFYANFSTGECKIFYNGSFESANDLIIYFGEVGDQSSVKLTLAANSSNSSVIVRCTKQSSYPSQVQISLNGILLG